MHRLRMQQNAKSDAIARPQSPQGVLNSCQNPSLKMKKTPRTKLIKSNFYFMIDVHEMLYILCETLVALIIYCFKLDFFSLVVTSKLFNEIL